MFEAMALEVKMNEALQVVDKNCIFLAEQLEKSNLRIAELEKQVAILTDRVEFLYDEPLP
jgi:hypothetical protein